MRDLSGDPVSGVVVEWSITAGTGSLSTTSTTTGADGMSATTLTPGTVGDIVVRAAVEGLGPVDFEVIGQAEWTDPIGDLVASGPGAHDITEVRAWPEDDTLVVEVEVAEVIDQSPESLGGNVLAVELDVDRDAGTGGEAGIDQAREELGLPPGSTGLGIEYDLVADWTGTVVISPDLSEIEDALALEVEGRVFRLTVGLDVIGSNDGIMNLAVFIAFGDPDDRLIDIAPETGHLDMSNPTGG